ncbi:MAG TPA: cysteine synthase family protein [Anaerolineales bacterium]|nr:cysteine synthase family protein [Anaerolineales bacterium]
MLSLEVRSSWAVREAEASFARVGGTPLIRLRAVAADLPETVEVYAKAEWHNPSGSVKDRPAAWILRDLLARGEPGPGQWLLDSTSGNMGIAYATLAAPLGYRVHLAIPANAGHERLTILRALGAELTLTDPSEGSDGARQEASELARRQPDRFIYLDQYDHPANWRSHFESTGPEVVAQTAGRLTHFVAGLGTTGTIVGTGRYLHQTAPGVKVVAVQPATPLHGLEGLKHLPSSVIPTIYDPSVPDAIVDVDTEAAYAMARRLARQEGLLVGISSAAAAAAALGLAHSLEEGVIVVLFPDSGLKYLGESFWNAP